MGKGFLPVDLLSCRLLVQEQFAIYMATNPNCLTANQLQCYRGQKRLYSDLSLTVKSGQMLLITGANGIGKTTLLRTLLGLEDSAGEITWCGTGIAEAPQVYHDALYYVGHQLSFNRDFTVLQQLIETCLLAGRQLTVAELLQHLAGLALEPLATSFISELSAGQKKRVILSVAPILTKKIWIFDEPLANLDSDAQTWVLEILATFLNSGGIVVLTSHDNQKFQCFSPQQLELRS